MGTEDDGETEREPWTVRRGGEGGSEGARERGSEGRRSACYF